MIGTTVRFRVDLKAIFDSVNHIVYFSFRFLITTKLFVPNHSSYAQYAQQLAVKLNGFDEGHGLKRSMQVCGI